jgi:LmbE family N-acetylglucosaminyl deacetylase
MFGIKGMIEELKIREDDRIAVIAPHPDDECLGAAAVLLLAPEKTDIYVLTDGSHGNPDVSYEEEAKIRRKQFEAEMEIVKPHSYHWLGWEDTTLSGNSKAVRSIDFTQYTKIFLPWEESLHPDHRAAAKLCRIAIWTQKAKAECFSYEVTAAFPKPTHYIDITALEQKKRELIRCHSDQKISEDITLKLNAFRAARLYYLEDVHLVEAYLKIDVYDGSETPDLLAKLWTVKRDSEVLDNLTRQNIQIKRVMSMDISKVYSFIEDNFAKQWADESLPALISGDCYVAVREREILGFLAFDSTAKSYIGPGGVHPSARGRGIFRALFLRAFISMIEKGYRYAILGQANPATRLCLKDMVEMQPITNSIGSYAEHI